MAYDAAGWMALPTAKHWRFAGVVRDDDTGLPTQGVKVEEKSRNSDDNAR
ncbi:hypothetical protein ACLB1N_25110 [Escherichia coli]